MAERRCMGCMAVTQQAVCEHCGCPVDYENEPHQLPVGTLLRGQYLVGRVLGQGGFGITYLGWDTYLEMPVAIKEYYPNAMVNRESRQTLAVHCYTEQVRSNYQFSKERFLREAKALAKLEGIPAIVRIRGFFPENETAYIIMEYVRGTNLAKYVSIRGGRLGVEETLRILRPVMEALAAVHRAELVHRDISPDNIMLHPRGGAKLLDFGAVRAVEDADTEKELNRSTEAILKHGFAPMEQYQNRGSLGPWSDVYALCATIYYCLTGCIPEDAPSRMMEERDPDWSGIPGLTERQRETLEKGMALRAKHRIRSMEELMQGLFATEERPEDAPEAVERVSERPEGKPEPRKLKHDPKHRGMYRPKRGKWLALAAAALAAVAIALAVFGRSGWYYQDGHYSYYRWPGSKLRDSWLESNKKSFYLDEDGNMVIGFFRIKGKTYYFDKAGVMVRGWQDVDGSRYYFNEVGVMATGKQKIDGAYYFFEDNGQLRK